MVNKIIAFHGRQIASIKELAKEDGTRNLGGIYFVDDPNKNYWEACTITETTDQQRLKEQISKGMVYVSI